VSQLHNRDHDNRISLSAVACSKLLQNLPHGVASALTGESRSAEWRMACRLRAKAVFGMRRAAAIAGVRTIVAPLWKIADTTEQALMDGFYK